MHALVFDFDGLILDTESPDHCAWSEIYAEHGLELPFERWLERVGSDGSGFDLCAPLEAHTGRSVDRAALRERRRRRKLDLLREEPPLPGVVAALESAQGRGLPCAVASNSSRAWVEGHLARLGLAGAFDALLCAEDATRLKPDPELYCAAVAALGVAPADALAFEDSPHGVRAARTAGLRCVAVPNPVTRHLDLGEADLVLASLAEVPLDALLARLQAARRGGPAAPRRERSA